MNSHKPVDTENLGTIGEDELFVSQYNLIEALQFLKDDSDEGIFRIKTNSHNSEF